MCQDTLIGKRLVSKTSAAVKGFVGSSPALGVIGLSFNGRIAGSNPADVGSNPTGPVYGGSSSVGKNAGL